MDACQDGRQSPPVRPRRESERRDGSRRAGKAGRDRYAVIDQARKRNRRTAMTEYLAIYERNSDGWWAYVPDLPGCTATGEDRDEVERHAREAVAAHVELLR